jgi:hypothetical protein
MPAPNELPHHGRADQTGPTKNEHTHDLPLLWKLAHRMARLAIKMRWLLVNIAVQRGPVTKTTQSRSGEEDSLRYLFRSD